MVAGDVMPGEAVTVEAVQHAQAGLVVALEDALAVVWLRNPKGALITEWSDVKKNVHRKL